MNAAVARSVLAHYDRSEAQLTFLGQSQNPTFRVETTTGERFLLRLHVGIETVNEAALSWQEPSVIQSELLWLNALAQDTDLIVPQPVQNCSGDWVTRIVSRDGAAVSCSLLRWVDGNHLEREPTVLQVRQLGRLMARLHNHASVGRRPLVLQ